MSPILLRVGCRGSRKSRTRGRRGGRKKSSLNLFPREGEGSHFFNNLEKKESERRGEVK